VRDLLVATTRSSTTNAGGSCFNPSVRDLLVATLMMHEALARFHVVSIPLCGICSLQHLILFDARHVDWVFQSLCAGFARCNPRRRRDIRRPVRSFNPSVRDLLVATCLGRG